MVLEVFAGVCGVAIVALALTDVFQSVIVPRSVGIRWRPSGRVARSGWRIWRERALAIPNAERREETLATYAPVLLTSLLVMWVAMLVLGYGCIFWALRDGITPHVDFGGALYFAGTSMLTIGYGDIVPTWAITRYFCLMAATSGLGVVAVVTTFLFQIFGAFQRREAFVVTMSERTGAPPSGVEFIKRHVNLGLVDDIAPIMRESQRWIAEVMETHLAYPILAYFRSSHDDESWVGTLGAILDAATLLTTTVELGCDGQAQLTLQGGTHLTRDFSHSFRLESGDAAGVEYDEFVAAYHGLQELEIPMRPVEDAWPAFSSKRASYASTLDAMARWWRIPPARWIGDRSRIRMHLNVAAPELPSPMSR